VLERECITIEDWLFIGATLWTDFNKGDPLTVHSAETMMNDYRGIKNTNDTRSWKFLPKHALEDHRLAKGYIKSVLENRRAQGVTDHNVVVVGHHAPTFQSIAEQYRGDALMNGCFASELSQIMLDNEEISLWIHGHTHNDFDYTVGNTRVVCNPRGYIGYEARVDTFELKYITL
jgi:hypothetical protein